LNAGAHLTQVICAQKEGENARSLSRPFSVLRHVLLIQTLADVYILKP
jgi:hypothetical protein